MKIAISGKGGAGKTTLAALLANSFASRGARVIAVDADPDANLVNALGFSRETSVTPVTELKELITDRVGAAPGQPTVYFKMNPKVDDIPDRYSVSRGNIRLMVMGTVRRGGSGCACPEHVIVKELISHLLIEREDVVIMDMQAGVEHLGRGTAQFVDGLVVVVQPTEASLQTCARIRKLAGDLGIKRVGVVANMVHDRAQLERIEETTGSAVWCAIPASDSLADYTGGPVDDTVSGEVQRLIGRLESEARSGADS